MSFSYEPFVEEVASNKPNASTAFNLPRSSASPVRTFFAAVANNAIVPYKAVSTTQFEEGYGQFASGSPDTLTRLSIVRSGTGSAIDFSGGSDVKVSIDFHAVLAGELDIALRALNPGGRLTLSSGNPRYHPINTVAVSGQDTTADTITVTAHDWTVGTMIKSDATSGGITVDTLYYAGNIATNTISLHTTLANALAGTSKLDITGAVTANITAIGVANQTIYYAPDVHNIISLWDGYRWKSVEFSEVSVAVGTVTAEVPLDIFGYLSSGALVLEKLAWTDATTRATELTLQDGRLCKSGDKTRLYLGTVLPDSTTGIRNSTDYVGGGWLGLVNFYNQIDFVTNVYDPTESWTYMTATWRQVRGAANNKVTYVAPFESTDLDLIYYYFINSTVANRASWNGLSIDATDGTNFICALSCAFGVASDYHFKSTKFYKSPIGKHYIAAIEYGHAGTGTRTIRGNDKFMGSNIIFKAKF